MASAHIFSIGFPFETSGEVTGLLGILEGFVLSFLGIRLHQNPFMGIRSDAVIAEKSQMAHVWLSEDFQVHLAGFCFLDLLFGFCFLSHPSASWHSKMFQAQLASPSVSSGHTVHVMRSPGARSWRMT